MPKGVAARFELLPGEVGASLPSVDLHDHPVRRLVLVVELQPATRERQGRFRPTGVDVAPAQRLEQAVVLLLRLAPHAVLPLVELETVAQDESLEEGATVEGGGRLEARKVGAGRDPVQP